LVAVLANLGVWVHGVTHTIQTAGGGDVPEEIWFLGQTPWAIVHGVNPISNNWLNAPLGVNLMDNTSMAVLGLVGAPITFLLGPIATFNVLLDLALAGSAMAFYFMARRFVRWRPAAFIGGLLYGFSPFAVAEATGHLFLALGVFPPLVVLLLDRYFRTKSDPPWRTGLLVGACFAAQFYVSTEVFASMIIMGLIAAVIGASYWFAKRPAVDVRGLAQLGGCAVAVFVVLAGYGGWMALLGPAHIHGPEQTRTALAGISVDPAGLITPTLTQQFTFGHATFGDMLVAQRDAHWRVIFDALIENGSYIGIPLLALLIGGSIVLRRKRLVLFGAVMAACALFISLGSYLHVGGTKTSIPLPFDVLAHLPLLESGEAARYMLFVWLFAALLLALILDALYRRINWHDRPGDRIRAATGCTVITLCVLLPLVPAWPYGSGPANVPTWFTTAARSLPVGSTAVVYPYASPADPSAMTWQAMANFTFKMPGGYVVFRSQAGTASFFATPSVLSGALGACEAGVAPEITPQITRAEIRSWGATRVVVASPYQGSACATRLFTEAYGQPTRQGGVLLWRVSEPR
jgi:hypothetical protein